jgi:hypothetical protein
LADSRTSAAGLCRKLRSAEIRHPVGHASAHRGKIVPHAVFLECRHHLYSEWSDRVAAILGKCFPVVEMASVDEAYIDLASRERLLGPPFAAAHPLLCEITATAGLQCSAGFARTRLIAKMASDQAKPRVWSDK